MMVMGQHEAPGVHEHDVRGLRGHEGLGGHGKLGGLGLERHEAGGVGKRHGDDERSDLREPHRARTSFGALDAEPIAQARVAFREKRDARATIMNTERGRRLGERGGDDHVAVGLRNPSHEGDDACAFRTT